MQNQFQRTESILGEDSTARLKDCRVAVFGVGGVGGYVTEALARSGIGTIDIIDSDKVDITNLNRQIIATHDTIGRSKVDVFKERIHSICPETTVNAYDRLYLPSSSAGDPNILTEHNVTAKISLISEADKAGTPIISAMGCGNRIDPSKLELTDIYKTHDDPLAKIIRKKLRGLGIKKLKVVYSTEEPMKPYASSKGPDTSISSGLPHDNKPTKRAPGSTPFVPASAGLMIASVVVRDLLII